mmetsp:Transcript_59687/g.142362  ORF Transcript_59687/g.142362 Transcript_59687/m.142362 type:complete len:301 (-) Transcript_59687:2168-3070(-)
MTIAALKAINFLSNPTTSSFQQLINSSAVLTVPGPHIQLARNLISDGPSSFLWPAFAANVCTIHQHGRHILEGVIVLAWIGLSALCHFLRRIPVHAKSAALCDWVLTALIRRRWLRQGEGSNHAAHDWIARVNNEVLLILLKALAEEKQFVAVARLETIRRLDIPTALGQHFVQGQHASLPLHQPNEKLGGRVVLHHPAARLGSGTLETEEGLAKNTLWHILEADLAFTWIHQKALSDNCWFIPFAQPSATEQFPTRISIGIGNIILFAVMGQVIGGIRLVILDRWRIVALNKLLVEVAA